MCMAYIRDPRGFECEDCEGKGEHPDPDGGGATNMMCASCDGSRYALCIMCGKRATIQERCLKGGGVAHYWYCSDACRDADVASDNVLEFRKGPVN